MLLRRVAGGAAAPPRLRRTLRPLAPLLALLLLARCALGTTPGAVVCRYDCPAGRRCSSACDADADAAAALPLLGACVRARASLPLPLLLRPRWPYLRHTRSRHARGSARCAARVALARALFAPPSFDSCGVRRSAARRRRTTRAAGAACWRRPPATRAPTQARCADARQRRFVRVACVQTLTRSFGVVR
jgi:hypothetical protein